MRSIVLGALLCVGTVAIAQDAPLIPITFEWPAPEPNVLPDLSVRDAVQGAIDSARDARTQASLARRLAAQAKRRAGLQGVFGINPNRATTDGETELAATRGTSGGAILGTVKYASGAEMTGSLSDNMGVYTGAPESPLLRFSGFVWGATESHPSPRTGIFEWKNGDTFVGSITGSGNLSQGVYIDANGGRRFIGTIDLSESQFRPVKGGMKDGSGKLLAIVRAPGRNR